MNRLNKYEAKTIVKIIVFNLGPWENKSQINFN